MQSRGFTYHYNASALGLGGVLHHDNGTTTIVPSLASVALAPTGGEGFSDISNYDKDGISFSNMRSAVIGYDSAYRTFTTSSDVFITNLNLFGRVKVAILQTSISSTREVHQHGDIRQESDPDRARFAMHAMIRGLTIDGIEVIPELDLELCECPTYAQFTDKIGGEGVATYAQRFGVEQQALQTVLDAKAQPIRASFVSALHHQPTDRLGPKQGFRLPVKNFGYIHFGELVVKPGRRRVNLLRIEFDSTVGMVEERGFFSRACELVGAAAEAFMATDPSTADVAPSSKSSTSKSSTSSSSSSLKSPSSGSMTLGSEDSNGAPSWP